MFASGEMIVIVVAAVPATVEVCIWVQLNEWQFVWEHLDAAYFAFIINSFPTDLRVSFTRVIYNLGTTRISENNAGKFWGNLEQTGKSRKILD